MKCEYCDKEIESGKQYCDFCGGKVDFAVKEQGVNQQSNATQTQTNQNRKSNTKKIVIIIIVSIIAVVGLFSVLTFVFFNFLKENVDISDYDYSEGTDDYYEDYYEDYFNDYFDDYFYDYDGGEYSGSNDFVAGEVDLTEKSYTSKFANLSFELPTNWEIADEEELTSIYYEEGASSSLYNNNLFVYDLYATDSFTGAILYISFYNADYFDEYKDIEAFNERVKEGIEDYEIYSYDIDYAEDSKLTINGIQYYQLAAQISKGGQNYYAYDFTRYVDGYYMQISLFTEDLETVGTIIDCFNK